MRVITFVSALVVAIPATALSQQSQLVPGQRVRITAPEIGLTRLAGIYESLNESELVVSAGSVVRVPLHALDRVEVHRGRRSYVWIGAGVGFLIGSVVSGVAMYQSCVNTYDCNTAVAWAAAGLGGAGGALLGIGIGALVRTDKWREVPLEDLRAGLGTTRDGGFMLSASLAF